MSSSCPSGMSFVYFWAAWRLISLAQVKQLSLLGVFVESTLGSSKLLLGLINIACICLYSDLFRNLSEALCNRISEWRLERWILGRLKCNLYMVSQLFCRTFFGWSIGRVVNLDTILNCAQISEGIGQGRVTANLEGWGVPARDGGAVDFWCQVCDRASIFYHPINKVEHQSYKLSRPVWIITVWLGLRWNYVSTILFCFIAGARCPHWTSQLQIYKFCPNMIDNVMYVLTFRWQMRRRYLLYLTF